MDNKKVLNKKTRLYLLTIVIALICGSLAFMVVINAKAGTIVSDEDDVIYIHPDQMSAKVEISPDFPKNDNGQTYGATFDPETCTAYETKPDLQVAVGVNGVEGYINTEEYEDMIDYIFDNQDMVISQRVEAIKNSVSALFKNISISNEEAEKYARSVGNHEMLVENSSEMLAELATNIEIARSSRALSDSDIATLCDQQVIEMQSNGVDPLSIDAEKIFVNQSVLEIIDRAMEDKCQTYINVYAVDGVTVVDQFRLNY